MKDLLCKAFCDNLIVRDVPAGVAVGTLSAMMASYFVSYIVPDGGLQNSARVMTG